MKNGEVFYKVLDKEQKYESIEGYEMNTHQEKLGKRMREDYL